MASHNGRALARISEEMDAVVAAIPDAEAEDLMRLLERLERLDTAYSWILDHIPTARPI